VSKKHREESNSIYWPKEFRKLKRGPAVVLPKDAGLIIALCGICKKSQVIDAGSGSGWLAAQIGKVARKVVSYEVREDFAKIAQENIRKLGLDNVEIRILDVMKEGFGKDMDEWADAVCLDMADSDKMLKHAFAALKDGGCVVGYLPHTEQLKAFVQAGIEAGFCKWYCCECNVREILVREHGVRPANIGLVHTAYLAFGRKEKNSKNEK
jgi:tRNA (adenine57-N1/adenine58-N1)-methyltransferase